MISAKVNVNVSGLKFVVAENKKRDVTLAGAKAGAKVLERAAKAEAPQRSRMLRKAQGVIAKKGSQGATISFAVQGTRKRIEAMVTLPGRKKPVRVVPAFYDHLVQGGTRPHSVSKGQRLERKGRMGKRGRIIGAVAQTSQGGRQHPGAKANPFRKRAWEAANTAAGEAALKAMGDKQVQLLIRAKVAEIKASRG